MYEKTQDTQIRLHSVFLISIMYTGLKARRLNMKITINENESYHETEIIINCRQTDEQILRICAGLRMHDKKVTGLLNEHTHILNANDILYADTVDRKTFLYTAKETYETPLKLYELEEQLIGEDFIRITKSCVLNFSKVKSLRGDFGGRMICTLQNNEKVCRRSYGVEIYRRFVLSRLRIDLHNSNGDSIWGDVHTDLNPDFYVDSVNVGSFFTLLHIRRPLY